MKSICKCFFHGNYALNHSDSSFLNPPEFACFFIFSSLHPKWICSFGTIGMMPVLWNCTFIQADRWLSESLCGENFSFLPYFHQSSSRWGNRRPIHMHLQQNDKFNLDYNSSVQKKFVIPFSRLWLIWFFLLSAHLLVGKGKNINKCPIQF